MYRSLILEHLSLNMLTNLRIFDLIVNLSENLLPVFREMFITNIGRYGCTTNIAHCGATNTMHHIASF